MLGGNMSKCPIVKIALPFQYGLHSKMFYCDEHSLTAEIYPMNEYQIERLSKEALLGMEHKGCIIPCEIKEYQFHDWLENKEKYLNQKGDENALQRYVGINPNSKIRNRKDGFSEFRPCYTTTMLCNDRVENFRVR